MKNLTSIIGGIAGAVSLNILHETARRFCSDAPRIDKVGEQALSKSLISAGINPPSGQKLYQATLAADVVSNAIYYSLIGIGKPKHLYLRGAIVGLAAGIGAVTLPQHLGLDDRGVNKNAMSSFLTVGYYLFGGLVTAAAIKCIRNEEAGSKKRVVKNAVL